MTKYTTLLYHKYYRKSHVTMCSGFFNRRNETTSTVGKGKQIIKLQHQRPEDMKCVAVCPGDY